jgi:hypothetical protein
MEESETGSAGRHANCRGSIALGTGCGRCAKCENEQQKLASAGGLTPPKRADIVSDIKGAIPEVLNGANTNQCVPLSSQAIAEAIKRPIGYVAHQEPMTIYELADGSMIRAKLVLMDVEVVEGVYTADGTPVYNCVWNHVTYISAPEHLKRRPDRDLG